MQLRITSISEFPLNTKRATGYQALAVTHSSNSSIPLHLNVIFTPQYDTLRCVDINTHSRPAESIHARTEAAFKGPEKLFFTLQTHEPSTQSVYSYAVITCHRHFRTPPRVRISFIKTRAHTHTHKRKPTSCAIRQDTCQRARGVRPRELLRKLHINHWVISAANLTLCRKIANGN